MYNTELLGVTGKYIAGPVGQHVSKLWPGRDVNAPESMSGRAPNKTAGGRVEVLEQRMHQGGHTHPELAYWMPEYILL